MLLDLIVLAILAWVAYYGAMAAEEKAVLFLVLENVSGSVPAAVHASRGTSLRLQSGRYVAPRIPPTHPIMHFTAFRHVVIDTDNETAMHADIDRWMQRECARLRTAATAMRYRAAASAVALSGKSHSAASVEQAIARAIEPLQCFVWPSACCSYALPRIDTMTADAKHAAAASAAIIPDAAAAKSCSPQASAAECTPPACRYFGPAHRCRPVDFCDFTSQLQCEQTGHCRYAYIKRSRRAKNFEWRCVKK